LAYDIGAREVIEIGHFDCRFFLRHPPEEKKRDSIIDDILDALYQDRKELQQEFQVLSVRLFFGRPLYSGDLLKFEELYE
jgi:hypothetical protein